MNKITLSLLSLGLLQLGTSTAMIKKSESTSYQSSASSLHKIADRYKDFLHQFGQKETGDLIPSMKSLFAPDCNKIVNGKTVSRSIPELHGQISEGKKSIGLWNVKKAGPYVASPEQNMVVAHFEIPTENQGTIVVMKYLICNNQGLIQTIDEVFNKKE